SFVRDRYVIHRGRSSLMAVWESDDTTHPDTSGRSSITSRTSVLSIVPPPTTRDCSGGFAPKSDHLMTRRRSQFFLVGLDGCRSPGRPVRQGHKPGGGPSARNLEPHLEPLRLRGIAVSPGEPAGRGAVQGGSDEQP